MANLLAVLEVTKRIGGELDVPGYSRPVPMNSVLLQ
jgi:hypothetical protein